METSRIMAQNDHIPNHLHVQKPNSENQTLPTFRRIGNPFLRIIPKTKTIRCLVLDSWGFCIIEILVVAFFGDEGM